MVIVVADPMLFLKLDVYLVLNSIGTLFAIVLVCCGVLVLQQQPEKKRGKFKVPYINGRFIYPPMLIVALVLIISKAPGHFQGLFTPEGFPMLLFWIVAVI